MLDFQNLDFFNGHKGQERQYASMWQSVNALLRYGDISILQNAGSRHLAFVKFENFNDRKGDEVQTASSS